MRRRLYAIIITFAMVIFTAIALAVSKHNAAIPVKDYISCVKAGNIVAYTYPSQCRTSDGQIFIQQFNNEARIPRGLPKERTWDEAKALIRTCQIKAAAITKNNVLLVLMQDDITLTIQPFDEKELSPVLQETKLRCGHEVAIAQE